MTGCWPAIGCASPKSHPQHFRSRIDSAASLAIADPTAHLVAMLLALKLILWAVRSMALSRQALVLDNLALRQQLAVAARGGCRPRLVTVDRAFWVYRGRLDDFSVERLMRFLTALHRDIRIVVGD